MKFRKMIAGIASATLCLGTFICTPMTVHAADSKSNPVSGDTKVDFYSYLLSKVDQVPGLNISYGVSYLRGTSSVAPEGNPSVTDQAKFSSSTDHYSTYYTTNTIDRTSVNINPGVTNINENFKSYYDDGYYSYAKDLVEMNFSSVSFYDVGDYDYLITENDTGYGSIRCPEKYAVLRAHVRYLTDENGDVQYDSTTNLPKYAAITYNMYKAVNKGTDATPNYVADTDNKIFGFTSFRETIRFELYHSITGNQASRDKYFKYTVSFTKLIPNTTYTVSTGYDDTVSNPETPDVHTNPTTITSDEKGNIANVEFWLNQRNKSALEIDGMDKGSTYTVKEDKTDLDTNGYTASLKKLEGDVMKEGYRTLKSGTYEYYNDSKYGKTNLSFSDDHNVTFTLYNTDDTTVSATYTGTWSQDESNITLNLKNGETDKKVVLNIASNMYEYNWLQVKSSELSEITALTVNSQYYCESPVTAEQDLAFNTTDYSLTDPSFSSNVSITFENSKQGAIPTGIILTTAPYVAALMIGLFGIIIYTKKKREQED